MDVLSRGCDWFTRDLKIWLNTWQLAVLIQNSLREDSE